MKVILLGPPGAGKGTQAKILSAELNAVHISTGDILRNAIKHNTALGIEAKKYVESGDLVPDTLVTKMVVERLNCADARKDFILDGFPRNLQQAEDLDKFLMVADGIDKCKVIYLDADENILIQRLSGRRTCKQCQAVYHLTNMPPKKAQVCDSCGGELYQRQDDKEETIKNRLSVYDRLTRPVVDYYFQGSRLFKIFANRQPELVLSEMLNVLKK